MLHFTQTVEFGRKGFALQDTSPMNPSSQCETVWWEKQNKTVLSPDFSWTIGHNRSRQSSISYSGNVGEQACHHSWTLINRFLFEVRIQKPCCIVSDGHDDTRCGTKSTFCSHNDRNIFYVSHKWHCSDLVFQGLKKLTLALNSEWHQQLGIFLRLTKGPVSAFPNRLL